VNFKRIRKILRSVQDWNQKENAPIDAWGSYKLPRIPLFCLRPVHVAMVQVLVCELSPHPISEAESDQVTLNSSSKSNELIGILSNIYNFVNSNFALSKFAILNFVTFPIHFTYFRNLYNSSDCG
jgi:hypothetical protein